MDRDELLADWLVRWEDEEPAKREAMLADFAREDPNLLPEFRAVLRGLGMFDESACTPRSQSETPSEPIESLVAGRYRPKSIHARGGLGPKRHGG